MVIQVAMTPANLSDLLHDLEAAVGLPTLVFIIGSINIKRSRDPKTRAFRTRVMLALLLVLVSVFLATVLYQDRSTLIELWKGSPTVFSIVYAVVLIVICSLLAIVLYSRLRPSMWLRDH